MAGLKIASPLPTARIESTISSSSASLRTYPRAPALSAMNTDSSSSRSVTTRTRMLGLSETILRVASIPLTFGICRSLRTTSGWSSAARATASSPVVASPMTSNSGTDPNREIMPLRKSGWSSATRMRRVSNFLSPLLRRQREAEHNPGTALWDGLDDADPTQLGGALAHRGEAHAGGALRRDADAVVHDLQVRSVLRGEPHDAGLRLGVANHVGQGLLRDAVDGHLHGRREGRQAGALRGFHRYPQVLILRAVTLGELAEGRNEPQVVEGRRT